ncbi:hypothetical protein SAMN05216275_11176 [Streptosporangium canum]|uniref:Uncharacterized protein n=1 Tax=Streptosporangium canum TaxID=324952 RepID=A0A1I3TDW9_9ACTN|nr:hypothetical protein [Streptosporangium canum]SFJ68810.1 hypothetical protein SAMN05216275_11176 [Streptosporangium canum]
MRGREGVELAGSIGANLCNLGALALHLSLGLGGSPVSLGHLRGGRSGYGCGQSGGGSGRIMAFGRPRTLT